VLLTCVDMYQALALWIKTLIWILKHRICGIVRIEHYKHNH